jgi:MSHA pilin protein MshD
MCTSRQRGMTLIELIVFVVIVSVALAGVLSVLNFTSKASADPMIRKQALAVAESVMEEVMLQPFTWCDPDDPAAGTAIDASACATAETMGPEAGETRGGAATPFDNVNDYNNVSPPIATSLGGTGSAPYVANVTVAAADLNTDILAASGAALLITVTVTAAGETIQLQGYRTRYSPNYLP